MSELTSALVRTLFMYFFILVMLRLMGKREIGKLSLFDLVVSIMMAEIAILVIEDTELSLLNGVLPIISLMIIQVILSYASLKSKRVRNIVEGKPATLIEKGIIRDDVMKKQRYTIDDLMTQLREKNYSNIADVEFAILETSGKLSVFPKPDHATVTKGDLNINLQKYAGLPVPLIADGKVLEKNLASIDKNLEWLRKLISQKGYQDFKEIYFLSIDQNKEIFIDPKDE